MLFPITFISNVFVPIETLPTWLQPIAEWNPTSTLTARAARAVGQPATRASDSFASPNPILVTIVWVVVFIAVFGPLGVRRYRIDEPLTSMLAPPWLLALGLGPRRCSS